MIASEVAKILATYPKSIFAINLGSSRHSYLGRILETHENIITKDRYGYSLNKPRRETTYTVEVITEKYNVQPICYEIRTHYHKVRTKDIEYVILDNRVGSDKPLTKTLEQLCDERTQNERNYRARMATDTARKETLVVELARVANVREYELRSLSLEVLEAIVKLLDKVEGVNASLYSGGLNDNHN